MIKLIDPSWFCFSIKLEDSVMNFKNPPKFAFVIIYFFFAVSIGVLNLSPAFAEGSDSSEMNFQFGDMLPDQIDGVTEILPMFGFLYSTSIAGAMLELGFLNAHASGVDYTQFPIRGRYDIPIDQYLNVIVYAGPELNYYTQLGTDSRTSIVGFNLGGGFIYHIMDTLWFRSEMKFSVNPGDSLYVGFGFTWRSGSGGQ